MMKHTAFCELRYVSLRFALLAALVLTIAGCSDDEPVVATTASPTTTAAPTTTSAGITCRVGLTLSAGGSCRHDDGASQFTFTVDADGFGCVGGICSGGGMQLNDFVADRDDGIWTIRGLPGVEAVETTTTSPTTETTAVAPVTTSAGITCRVGLTLSAGGSCRHDDGASQFTFTVDADGFGCVGGICSGGGMQLNDFVADRDGGIWTIRGLPGVEAVETTTTSRTTTVAPTTTTRPTTTTTRPPPSEDALTLSPLECSGVPGHVFIKGSITANIAVSSVDVRGFVDKRFIGRDNLGSMRAGETKTYIISGTGGHNRSYCEIIVDVGD